MDRVVPEHNHVMGVVADGYLEVNNSVNIWQWTPEHFVAHIVAEVQDKCQGLDLAPYLTLREEDVAVLMSADEYLGRAMGIPSLAVIPYYLEFLHKTPSKSLLVMATAPFSFVMKLEERQLVQQYMLEFIRIVLLLKWARALENQGMAFKTIKRLSVYGSTPKLYRDIVTNWQRLQSNPLLRSFLTSAEVGYFDRTDLVFALKWYVSNHALLQLETWKYATSKEVLFDDITNFCLEFSIATFPADFLQRFGKDNIQLLVFKYVLASTDMVALSDAFAACAKFTLVTDFEVNARVKQKAVAAAKTIHEV
jgi:hypothetical protein